MGVDRRPRPADPARFALMDLAEEDCLPALAKWAGWAEVVFHLAGEVGIRSRAPDIALRRRRNIIDAARMVLAASPPHRRLVAVSSSSVYGGAAAARGRITASREEDRPAPVGEYARLKLEMEELFRESGRPAAIARPFTVIGEGQRPDMAVSLWMEAVRRGRPVRVFGSLERTRDVTDVRLVAAALVRIAQTGAAGLFNLGAGRGRTLREMVEAVFSALGSDSPVVVEPAAPEEAAHTLADPSRAARVLGVDLTTDLEAAVRRQAAARAPWRAAV